ESGHRHIASDGQEGVSGLGRLFYFLADCGVCRCVLAAMNERSCMPAFDATADITGAFLSSMVVAIHCRRCKHYAPVAGLMDQPLVLWRHRGHLGEVTADLLICDRDTNRISELRLCLVPLEIQIFLMN